MAVEMKSAVQAFGDAARAIEREVGQVIVGQSAVVREVLICILAGRHALLEGVPGLGKTMLVRAFADALDLKFSRIQCTPDMQPADITGTDILEDAETGRGKVRRFLPGPVFANLVLADEINRATPKTQSALLEAMAEKTVTVFGRRYDLEAPFFVLATQNPLEMEGTYPLPEAQLDRFMFKVNVPFPSARGLVDILERTTGNEDAKASKVTDGVQLAAMARQALDVPIKPELTEYAARLVVATHPDGEGAPARVRELVRYGASPRGAQALIIGAKIHALLEGEANVSAVDIDAVAPAALRHRVLLQYGVTEVPPDALIADVIAAIGKPR